MGQRSGKTVIRRAGDETVEGKSAKWPSRLRVGCPGRQGVGAQATSSSPHRLGCGRRWSRSRSGPVPAGLQRTVQHDEAGRSRVRERRQPGRGRPGDRGRREPITCGVGRPDWPSYSGPSPMRYRDPNATPERSGSRSRGEAREARGSAAQQHEATGEDAL